MGSKTGWITIGMSLNPLRILPCTHFVVLNLSLPSCRRTGSKWWLNKIRVPSIVINARDDPFIEETSLPGEADLAYEIPGEVSLSPTTSVSFCNSDGLASAEILELSGKTEDSLDRDRTIRSSVESRKTVARYAPVRLVYTQQGGHCGFVSSIFASVPEHGWLAEELSRALFHIHSQCYDSGGVLE